MKKISIFWMILLNSVLLLAESSTQITLDLYEKIGQTGQHYSGGGSKTFYIENNVSRVIVTEACFDDNGYLQLNGETIYSNDDGCTNWGCLSTYVDITDKVKRGNNILYGYADDCGGYRAQASATLEIYYNSCDQNDTDFPPLAQNQQSIDAWSEPEDRGTQCTENNGTVQERLHTCKKEFRCVKTTQEKPKECDVQTGSYVSPRNRSFHEDISLPGVAFGLHYASYERNNTLAQGWMPDGYATLKHGMMHLGSGVLYRVSQTRDEDGLRVVTYGQNQYLFDANGKLQSIRDLYTKETQTTFGYDAMGRLVTLTDMYGEITTLERDSDGKVTAVVAPTGQRTLLTIDNSGDLTEVQYEDTASYAFEYKNHLLTKETEPNGNTFLHFFNETGRLVKVIDAQQGVWAFDTSVGTDFDRQKVIQAAGDVLTYKKYFVQNGMLKIEKLLPSGDVIGYENALDDSSSTVRSCGMKTASFYRKNADGTLYQDPYTQRRRLEKRTVTTPGGLQKVTLFSQTYSLDAHGKLKNVDTTVTLNGKPVDTQRNYKRHKAVVISPLGEKSVTRYDSRNENITVLHPYGRHKTSYRYNDTGRVIREKTGRRTTRYTYDGKERLASITDPVGRTTAYSYDERDRITGITYPDGTTLHYAYDANGNMTLLRTPTPADYTFGYNGVNKRTAYTTPLQKVTTYRYDKQRRLTRVTRPSGKSIDFTYTDGRVTDITTPEDTIAYTYACQDNPGSIVKGSEKITYTYDGTLPTDITLAGTLSQSIGYRYNNDFLPAGITYAGSSETYGYNDDNERIASGRYTITRKDKNRKTVLTDGSYKKTVWLNQYGEVKKYKDTALKVTLQRNKAGQIVKKTEKQKRAKKKVYRYTYDAKGRLATVTQHRQVIESYAYDSNGNRQSATVYGTTTAASYTLDDQLEVYGDNSYSYDDNGFLTQKTTPNGTTAYTYDTLGALTDATLPDGTTIHYVTDPLNRRIAREVNGTITEKYLWEDLTTLLAVYDKDNNLVWRFEYADGRMPVSMTDKGGNRYYLHYDQVGSLHVVTDANRNIVKEITYDTYGNIINDSNRSLKVPFGFAGGLYDPDTKLTHFGYREYDAYTGKWTSKDPILFEGGDSNLYGYVLGDPVNLVDPEGLMTKKLSNKVDYEAVRGNYCKGGFEAAIDFCSQYFYNANSECRNYVGRLATGLEDAKCKKGDECQK